jgi:sulfur carrier protein ThiS
MRVHLKLFASLGERLPDELHGHRRQGNELAMDVPDGTAVQDVIERLQLPAGLVHLVLVNGLFVHPADRAAHRLAEGDALAVWPPVAGG